VRNPGYSLKAEERLGEPGSETRNPKIAAILHDVKYAETKGSGIRVMRELMDERNLSMPLLQSDRTGNSFLVMLLFHHFLSQEDLDWLKWFEHDSLNDGEMKAMISAREVGAIDNSTYRDINRGSDTLSASKHLRKLCDCGLLEKRGQGPATYYIPTDRALEKWPPNLANDSKTHEVAGKSTKLEAKTTKLDDKTTKLEGKTTSQDEELPMLPTEIRRLIDSLGGKGNLSTAFDAVVALLKWKELSVKEIASYIDRTPSHVRREYIAPLVQADLIRPTIPGNPTDPRQTYRATNAPKKDVK
jgi:ATP-dependent DNA helicase RecG